MVLPAGVVTAQTAAGDSRQGIRAAGSFHARPVDVRIVATTSADLQRAVEMGEFREDLLMALNVAQVDIPSLRERPEDILLLADRHLAYLSREHHKPIAGFTRDATFVLKTHLWPGNTRELRNVVERAVLACTTELVGLEHLPADLMNATIKSREPDLNGYQVGDLVPLEAETVRVPARSIERRTPLRPRELRSTGR